MKQMSERNKLAQDFQSKLFYPLANLCGQDFPPERVLKAQQNITSMSYKMHMKVTYTPRFPKPDFRLSEVSVGSFNYNLKAYVVEGKGCV